MRYRTFAMHAPNMNKYINRIKKVEDNYLTESALINIGLIALNEKEDDSDDEYGMLGPNSSYKITHIGLHNKKIRRNKQFSNCYFRKKIIFRQKRRRSTNDSTTI